MPLKDAPPLSSADPRTWPVAMVTAGGSAATAGTVASARSRMVVDGVRMRVSSAGRLYRLGVAESLVFRRVGARKGAKVAKGGGWRRGRKNELGRGVRTLAK